MRRTANGKLTKAIPHIALQDANHGKLAALDALWDVYQGLCDDYIGYFCTQVAPDAEIDFVFDSALSARWQRVAVQQAAGIAQSWRSNRANAWTDYQARVQRYESLEQTHRQQRKAPTWTDFQVPRLHAVCIQATVNVVQPMSENAATLALEASERGQFEYWLRISTLEKGKPIYIPVRLSAYHKTALEGLSPNSSVTLNRRQDRWWLTLTTTQPLPPVAPEGARGTVGMDIGIRHTLTDSTGKHYGAFSDKLRKDNQREQEKRQRKAKLRACLKKKGCERLPRLSSASGVRLARCTRQAINFAVNRFFDDHAAYRIAAEALSIAAMRFKSHRMNGVLKASDLAHIVRQVKWNATKRGVALVFVQAAYSSQECPHCHFTARANRPNQQTFCCTVCGFAENADVVAACNLEKRLDDAPLAACRTFQDVQAVVRRPPCRVVCAPSIRMPVVYPSRLVRHFIEPLTGVWEHIKYGLP